MSKIGLVTVLFNSDEVLPGFFESISRQDHKDYILYLIDNSPNPATDELILEYSSRYPVTAFKHIKSPGNIGVAEGNNIGIRNSLADDCSQVLLLNNDIELPQSHVFSCLLKLCEKGERIVVPKILYYDTRKVWMAGGVMNQWRALGIHYGYDKSDAPEYNIARYITYAPTCFMMIESSLFKTVGMMDAKYFAYYDDTDWVLRATRAGCKLYYEPALTVLHKVSSSSGGDESPFYIYYSNRNKIYFARKNLRGLVRIIAISYTLFTRMFYYIRFNSKQRKKLVEGLKDGFRIPCKGS